ncbi:MAG TPA: hypothetical protein VD947_01630 [Patescibacteria group bacterium]|nr:hypothetical protein [Patescibacteria group bacterium]
MKTIRAEVDLAEAKSLLLQMEADSSFVTQSAYRANIERWPKNRISFIDIHMEYLRTHPQISIKDYISNLRLKLRKT